jgi:hypothetical protein
MNKKILDKLNESISQFNAELSYDVANGLELNKSFKYLNIIFDEEYYSFEIETKQVILTKHSVMEITYELQLAGMIIDRLEETLNNYKDYIN